MGTINVGSAMANRAVLSNAAFSAILNTVVIYARFSSQGQNEQSIEAQIRICREYAERLGFKVVKIYIDKARTGTNDNRPEFQKMISEAAGGTFQNIIVYKFDRFARNRFDSMMHKQQLKKQYGIRVISATEPVSDDEGGEIYEMFLEWNDEKYSQRLSKRVRHGLDLSMANGLFCGGYLIYGYNLIDTDKVGRKGTLHKVVINDEQAAIVRYAFEQYDRGVTKKEIAAALNAKGHRYKDGRLFTSKIFDRWLVNEKYTGEFNFGGRDCGIMYPSIIDNALYERVRERLRKNRYFAGGIAIARVPYFLTGKAFCGHCETDMNSDGGTGRGKQYNYYACKKRKIHLCNKRRENKDALEFYVAQGIFDFLSDKQNVNIAVDDVLSYYEQRTANNGIKSLETKIANVRQEIDELANAFVKAKSDILQSTIEKKITENEILLNDLTAQKGQIELEQGFKITKDDLILFISELLKGNIDDKDYQKKIIDNLVYMVYVYDDMVVTYLNIKGGVVVEHIGLDITNEAVNGALSVQRRIAPVNQARPSLNQKE